MKQDRILSLLQRSLMIASAVLCALNMSMRLYGWAALNGLCVLYLAVAIALTEG